jgi:hypothetical protein
MTPQIFEFSGCSRPAHRSGFRQLRPLALSEVRALAELHASPVAARTAAGLVRSGAGRGLDFAENRTFFKVTTIRCYPHLSDGHETKEQL